MESWLIILFSLCVSFILNSFLFPIIRSRNSKCSLPPGPPALPIIGNHFLQMKFFPEVETLVKKLLRKYGNIVTLHIASRPYIFVSDHSLAHEALVQNAAVFSDRPNAIAATATHHNIFSASYGPTWRILRRNLASEILNPSSIRSYSHARKWVLDGLINGLKSHSNSKDPVRIADHFRHAIFKLAAFMCFGAKLEDEQVKQIKDVGHRLLSSSRESHILSVWPRATKIFFPKRWKRFLQIRKEEQDIFIPLIRARQYQKEQNIKKEKGTPEYRNLQALSYADTLLDLELPDEKRKLKDNEIIDLCSEFLNGVCDTTSTELQWIMANLVKYPHIQEKLYEEIKKVLGEGEKEVKETDLSKMKYLKAIVLEGLRRHPPVHFAIPHTVTEDAELGGYLVPKNGTINFMLAEMGLDSKVWDDPMQFRPERFLGGGERFDVTGSKEIKMAPFGAGKRICPAFSLAMLHLEYFVANLIWHFNWRPFGEDGVDLSEKLGFTIEMKNPLQALISSRNL